MLNYFLQYFVLQPVKRLSICASEPLQTRASTGNVTYVVFATAVSPIQAWTFDLQWIGVKHYLLSYVMNGF